MAKKKGPSIIHIGNKYTDEHNYYEYYLYHPKSKWWLLLLLLPLSLLIQCERTIDARCLEPNTNDPIPDINVDMHYNAYLIIDKAGFSWIRPISRTETTNDDGIATFSKLPCSVYSYIFACLSEASFTAKSECYAAVDQKCNFHYTSSIDLVMDPRREDIFVQVRDLETDDILPGAEVIFKFNDGRDNRTETTTTDAMGIATVENVRYCSVIDEITASRYGYADTIATDIDARDLNVPSDEMVLRLRPLKEKFTFFVKDKETKQPIAQAKAQVVLQHPNGSKNEQTLFTSTDGKGIAMYEDAFVLSTIAIHASKLHYKDGDLEGGPWTVDKFKDQDEDTRTVWLEPEPFTVEFVNVDSINGKPIAGVKNKVKVTDPAGKVEEFESISNSAGVFPVKAKENSKIEIISQHKPDYIDKSTVIPKFSKKEVIKMQPVMVDLKFRTLLEPAGTLLPDCSLSVKGTISGSLPPSNSGNGEFNVKARYAENLSITASKTGYKTNNRSVNNKPVRELETDPQSERDIPLEMDIPPCNGGKNVPKNNDNRHERSYGMGQNSGSSTIWVDFYACGDWLTLYDGVGTGGAILTNKVNGKPINRYFIENKETLSFDFTKGAVTVVIESDTGSNWEYEVRCP